MNTRKYRCQVRVVDEALAPEVLLDQSMVLAMGATDQESALRFPLNILGHPDWHFHCEVRYSSLQQQVQVAFALEESPQVSSSDWLFAWIQKLDALPGRQQRRKSQAHKPRSVTYAAKGGEALEFSATLPDGYMHDIEIRILQEDHLYWESEINEEAYEKNTVGKGIQVDLSDEQAWRIASELFSLQQSASMPINTLAGLRNNPATQADLPVV